jgi:hypothetical protein
MLYNVNFKTGKLEAINETDGDKNNLEVGRVLHLNGYNDPDYVIVKNRGVDPKWTSYGAMYDIVNLDTGADERQQAYTLKWLKEKKDGRIQVYITDKVMDQQEMTWALIAAKAVKAENDRKAQEKAERLAQEKNDLPGRFPYLTQGTRETTGAANIRIELKRAFPSIKFSVRTKHRGSSSININWTDGPTTEQVKKVTDKYQEGSFNGMEDIYEYNHDHVWPDVFGGARYVCENRHESPKLIAKAAKEYGYDTDGESDNYGVLPGLDRELSQMIYRKARNMEDMPVVQEKYDHDKVLRRQLRLDRAARTNDRNCKRNGSAMYY